MIFNDSVDLQRSVRFLSTLKFLRAIIFEKKKERNVFRRRRKLLRSAGETIYNGCKVCLTGL